MQLSRLAVRVRNLILAGLLVTVPIGITVAVTVWVFQRLTGLLPALLRRADFPFADELLRNDVSQFGVRLLSLVVLLLALLIAGAIARNVVGRRIIALLEQLILKIPMVSSVYSTVQQIGASLLSSDSGMFRRVVLVEYPREGCYVIGFVTADACEECDDRLAADLVSVFVPTTPNPTSGFLLMVARRELVFLDMNVTDAMRLVISGGVVRPPRRTLIDRIIPRAPEPGENSGEL
jgi:uncharacterized membrane protein